MIRKVTRTRTLIGSTVVFLSLMLSPSFVMAHLGNHPQVYPSANVTATYYTYHDWQQGMSYFIDQCGYVYGFYSLAIGNTISRGGGNTLTFTDTRLRSYNLSGNNPEAAGYQIKSQYDGSSVVGSYYNWRWSYNGNNTWVIPSGSTYIYQSTYFPAPTSSSAPAYLRVNHAHGDGNLGTDPSTTGCPNYDYVLYYP